VFEGSVCVVLVRVFWLVGKTCEDVFSGPKTKRFPSVYVSSSTEERGKASGAVNSEDAREFGTYGTS
jgi:hypothetical protein